MLEAALLFLPGWWVGGAGTFLQAALEQIVTESSMQTQMQQEKGVSYVQDQTPPQCLLSFMPKFNPASHLQKEMFQVSGGATGWRADLSPAVGGRDPPPQQDYTCVWGGSVRSSVLGEPTRVPAAQSGGGLCPADQILPASSSRRLSLGQRQELPGSPSVSLEDSSCQVLHTRKTLPSCFLPSGTS